MMCSEIAQQSANIVSYRAPSYGMFTTTLETQYWFGVPRNVSFAGLSMDMDYLSRQAVDKQNDTQNWVNYNKSTGARYSAMEHLVPEQMFSTDTAPAEGVSAVKALALASAEGQRIYTITADNVESALAAINIGPDTETEIRNAAYAGKEITTHQYQINFNGWIGEGYIIVDPETGAGAYKIAGGGNGSWISGVIWIVIAIWLTVAVSAFLVALFTLNIPALLVALSALQAMIQIINASRICPAIQYVGVVVASVTSFVLGLMAQLPNWLSALVMGGQGLIPEPEGC